MKLPNFLIIGAGKAGTTSVYRYLQQHPEVFVSPVKEPGFFVWEGQRHALLPDRRMPVRSLEAYAALFEGVRGEKAVGEASPSYLVDPLAAARIRERLPQVRLIAILRDPVERAWSSYWMTVRDGRERRSFEQAVADELSAWPGPPPERPYESYLWRGRYAHHLGPYLERFERARIRVCLFDDLAADPRAFMGELYRYLEVDDRFAPTTALRYNASGLPRHRLLGPLLNKSALSRTLRRLLPPAFGRRGALVQDALRSRLLARPPLAPALRRRLVACYRDDILALQDLLGRDLSHWLA
jgi:hypothetical protein